MKEDKFLIGQIEDKINMARDKYIPAFTGFLDGHEHKVASETLKTLGTADLTVKFFGGYEDAERELMIALPDYASLEEYNPLSVLRISVKEGGRKLGHGDYLGSVLGLGITRDKIGDILVRDDGCDMIIMKDIEDFLLTHYVKAGRTYLSLEIVSLDELMIPEQNVKVMKDTVASLRLDNIVSSAFGLSRSKSLAAIKQGRVFVDNVEELRPDFQVDEGQKIVLRGSGKIVLKEIGGKSKKGRQYIEFEKYC